MCMPPLEITKNRYLVSKRHKTKMRSNIMSYLIYYCLLYTCVFHAENDFGLGIRQTGVRPDIYRQVNRKIMRLGTMNETIYDKML